MTESRPQEPRAGFARRFTARISVRLVGAAGGIFLALLIAPATRRLCLAQMGLTLPFPATLTSVAGSELGIKPDPFESRLAYRNARVVGARHPDDLQIQIANAGLPDSNGFSTTRKLQRLRALESRFADRPALYANILRYATMGEIRAHHMVEQYELMGEPVTKSVREMEAKSIDEDAYAVYDREADEGERLDPNNAYFPLMRAIGLFGARRDDEALAAIARAARKPLWREYYNDELLGQWRLQDESSVNNSALFHALSAASLLFPQYAQMRSVARVTIVAAVYAEQGHRRIAEGLALRKNVLRIGSLMRDQSRILIGSLVGIAITEHATMSPGGELFFKIDGGHKEQENREKQRDQFDAYLRRVGRAGEIDAFHSAQQAGDEIRDLVKNGMEGLPFDRPILSLITWWWVDLLTLSNILWLLMLGGLAALFLRCRRLQSGQPLPGYARLAIPLGLIGGALAAPALLTGFSSYFMDIADGDRISMLLTGLAPALVLFIPPIRTVHEWKNRVGSFGAGLLFGVLLTALYFWQIHGIAAIAGLSRVYFNLSGGDGSFNLDLGAWVPWSSACVSLLMLIAVSIISRACRVPLSVGLARGFRGLMAPVAAVLFLAYGGMMFFTVRAEAAVQYGLNRTLENEGQYIADQSGRLWPRSDVAGKMVGR